MVGVNNVKTKQKGGEKKRMKKLLMVVVLCAAFMLALGPVVAQAESPFTVYVCGIASVNSITLTDSTYEDIPIGNGIVDLDLCITEIRGDEVNSIHYPIVATAFGTQINLALLKAQNMVELFGVCVEIWLYCPPGEVVCGGRITSFECLPESVDPCN